MNNVLNELHERQLSAGIGIDVGGTKTMGVLIDPSGAVVARARRDTPRGSADVLDACAVMAGELRDMADRAGLVVGPIAIGMPGTVDSANGRLVASPVLEMDDVAVVDLVQARVEHPITVLHDVKAAAFGELMAGAGIGEGDAAYINLGTGVSMAFVFGWRIHHGHDGTAGEIGHVVVDPGGTGCNCGRRGCLETVASGPAIARMAGHEGVPLEQVAEAARAGDASASAAFARAAEHLGATLADYLMVLNLRLLLVGGGVSNVGSLLLDPLQQSIDHHLADVVESVRVVPAALAAESGVIGAAHWSRVACQGHAVRGW